MPVCVRCSTWQGGKALVRALEENHSIKFLEVGGNSFSMHSQMRIAARLEANLARCARVGLSVCVLVWFTCVLVGVGGACFAMLNRHSVWKVTLTRMC
jgi:hypothetical protein